ncbi:60Kd inner membrane protein, partial [Streptomyces coelicoflavus ZG0656]
MTATSSRSRTRSRAWEPRPSPLAPYGSVQRQGVPPLAGSSHIVHEGAIGAFGKPGEYRTEQKKYKDWLKEPRIENASIGGWLGITDKYWLAALLPQQDEA